MRITKFGHACVRVESGSAALVLDPGVWTGREALDDVTAVLVTHEHPDHYHPDHLRAADVPVFTIEAVAARIREEAPDLADRVRVVAPGEEFDAGLRVRAVGELHAVIHPELPRFHNSGYLVSDDRHKVFHPGDALTGPGEPVDVLCAPVSAPWLKASEAVDFAREVGAPRVLAIHDRVYSEAGLAIVDGHFATLLPEGQDYRRLADGEDLPL